MALVHMTNTDLKEIYRQALLKHRNHISKAAKEVGHSRVTFLKYARKFNLWPKNRHKVWDFKRAA